MKRFIFQLNVKVTNTLATFGIMKFLKGVFAFYINSSIHVALAVVALLLITILEYNLSVPKMFLAFVFLAVLTGYNFVKYAKIAGLHHRSLTNSLRIIQIFQAVCFVLLFVVALQLSLKTLLVMGGFGLATFFYAVPFIRNKNLRNFSSLKIFIVAFIWAGVTVIAPMVALETSISGDVLLTFFQRILIVIVLILPFEIRDVPYDSLNLKTLPQQLGVGNTKLLGGFLTLLCVGVEFFKETSSVAYIVSLLVFCFTMGWMLNLSKIEQPRYFSSFWVEGLPIIWFLLFFLFQKF